MFIKPKAGLKVRDPQTRAHIPDDGIEVSDTDLHWARLVICGDVEVIGDDAEATEDLPALPAPDAS